MYNCTAVTKTMIRLVLGRYFQGDSLSPLLFVLRVLMPLSSILNDTSKRFILEKGYFTAKPYVVPG